MKKKALLSALLMLMSFGIANAKVVTIGDGTDNDLAMLPVRAGNNYSFSQQIFTSKEIGESGEITHIAFRKYTERAVTRNITIYMVQTDKSAFTSSNDWISTKEGDKVFSGEVTFDEGTDWTNIKLDRSYEYWDAQNLAVIVDDNTGEGAGGAILFYSTSCSDTRAIIAAGDADIDLASYSSSSGTLQSSINQVKISITPLNKDVVKVGGGLHSTTALPCNFGYEWNVSQQIYTPSEVGGAGTIKAIAYKTGLNDFSSKYRKGDLYMMHTDKSTFANGNDWLSVTNATKVFSGAWGPSWKNYQVEITLTTPFDYDGVSNLALIWVDENYSAQGNPQPDFLTFDAPSQAIYSHTSISAYDPSKLFSGSTAYTGNVLNEKNQMWFSIIPLSVIGDGTGTNAELPIRTAYNFSYSEQIYTPAEIGRTGFITGFSFYCASASYASFQRWLDVYVKTTDQNAFSTQNDWIPVEDEDMYFSGYVTIKKNGWVKVTFDKPFRYNGKKNLLIGIDDNSATSASDAYFRAFFDADYQYRALYAASASDIYPQGDMSPVTGNRRDFKTSLMISFQDQWAVGSGDAEVSSMPVYPLYNYSITQQVYTPAELVKEKNDITSLSFFNTGYQMTRNIDIYLSSTDYFEKYADEYSWKPVTAKNMVFSGEVTFVSGDWTDIPLNKVYNYISYGGGSHSLVVTIVDKTGTYSMSTTKFLAYPAEAQALFAYSDYRTYDAENMTDVKGNLGAYKNQIQFNNVAANIKPTAFRVTDLAFTSATVEWMGEAPTSWNLEYKAEDETDWTHYGLPKTVNSFVLSGLKPLTNYYARVQSVDGSDTSDWTELKLSTDLTPTLFEVAETTYNSATFTWGGPGKKWQLRYQVYGETDWNEVNDITEQPYTLTGLEQETDYYVNLRVVDDNGNAGSWVAAYFSTPEQYPRPTDFALVEATPYSAIFSLTENCGATEWEYCLMDKNNEVIKTVRATSIPYVFVGLEQDTEYYIKVRSVIDSEGEVFSNWSVTGNFTTLPVNEGIYGVAVDAKTNSATVTWEGESEKYKVNCRKYSHEAAFFEDFETADFATNGWTIIANGATKTGEDGWYYSTETSYSGLYSAETCSWYYNGIEGVPLDADNWLISPVLDLQGILEFWQFEYSGNADSYEVLISTTGKDIADFTTVLREMAPGFVGWNLMTFDLSAFEGQQGYVAIHHKDNDVYKLCIDDFGIFKANPYPWETIETTEKTATFEGLEADTNYEFYIVGSTHGQEDVYTSNMVFTTLVNNPVPYNIDVTTTPNSASFEWEGNSDMYVLQYREVMHDPTFFEGFEATDLATTGWTVYTNGESPYTDGWRAAETESAHNGSKAAIAMSWLSETDYNADNWLVSPKVDLGGTLKFYQCVRADYPDEYEVLISTTGNTPSDFTTTLRSMGPAFHGAGTEYRWVPVTFDLSAYESMSGYIAIHHRDNGKNRLLIDDFGIYASASNYSTWQTAWTQEKSKTIEGLKEGTEYEIFITGSKTGEPDAQTDIFSFTTKLNDPVELTFYDDVNNESVIQYNDGVYANVTIQGRTFKKDGKWQTICLPFDVDVENSVLAGADVRTLENSTYFEEEETLIMDFLTPVTKMEAGVPYIIRWEEGADIVNPVFNAVTVAGSTLYNEIYTYYNYVRYDGVYFNYTWTSGLSDQYWVLADDSSKLANLDDGYEFHAFDAYFEKVNPYFEAKTLILNTGDGDELVTGISSVGNAGENEVIYNLAGQRLAKKQRGINIVNGKKILVK